MRNKWSFTLIVFLSGVLFFYQGQAFAEGNAIVPGLNLNIGSSTKPADVSVTLQILLMITYCLLHQLSLY